MSAQARLKLFSTEVDQQPGNDVAHLTRELWERLHAETNQGITGDVKEKNNNPTTYITVSIRTPLLTPESSPLSGVSSISQINRTIVIHALPFDSNGSIIFLPETLAFQMFDRTQCKNLQEADEDDNNPDWMVEIEGVSLIHLDEVVLGSVGPEAYDFAIKNSVALLENFRPPQAPPTILRQSQIYRIPHGGLTYKVLMNSPVLQGVLGPTTKFIITDLSTDEISEFDPEPEPTLKEISPSADHFLNSYATQKDFITFLSLPIPPLPLPPSVPTLEEFHTFHPIILKYPYPPTRLSPPPAQDADPDAHILVHISDLLRIGAFSGDLVFIAGPDHKKSRLVRIYGVTDRGAIPGEAYLSPLLHFNLGFLLPPQNSTEQIHITKLANQPEMGIPVATAVTVARVASPSSTDKALHSAFLEKLKRTFECGQKVVVEGDLIAIGVAEDLARMKPQKKDIETESWDEFSLPTSQPPTTLVYFKITSLKSQPLPSSSNATKSPSDPTYYGFGRRVDPQLTNMVQLGLEHSRVPAGTGEGAGRFIGITNLPPPLPPPQEATETQRTLYNLLLSTLHPLAANLSFIPTIIFRGPRGSGKRTLLRQLTLSLGLHLFELDCYDLAAETDSKTEAYLRARVEKAAQFSPCVICLRGLEALARKSAALESGMEPWVAAVLVDLFETLRKSFRDTGWPVTVVATTEDLDKIPTSVVGCFIHEVIMEAPNEQTRYRMLVDLTARSPLAPDVSLASLATQTAALVAKDIVDLFARAGIAATDRVIASIIKNGQNVLDYDITAAGITLTAADFDTALGKARSSYSDSIGAPKIPNVTWDDVGGLAAVKDDILDTIQLPLEHPELFADGMKKRSGILLYGPPGTGKTLLAKAVATSCSLNFFSVKGPELLNMYIGESEANVRRVFQRARDAKPCVIFFDELDSVAPKRGEKGDSGGVMDRIVSQLLAELDGMSDGGKSADVFVIGATNRPDLLDPALLRPGRFDKLLYLGVSDTHEAQLKIVESLTRKFRLNRDLGLRRIVDRCPFNYTGADFYALCSDAMLKAMSRVADAIEDKVAQMNLVRPADATYPSPLTSQYFLSHLATAEDILVEVREEDFLRAVSELVPSVSQGELDHYKKVRELFEGNFKKELVEEDTDVPEGMNNYMDKEDGTWVLGPVEKEIENIESVTRITNGSANGKSKGKGKDKGKGKEVVHIR